MKSSYKFKSDVWLYPGNTPWHFVNVPKKESKEIKEAFGARARGWGSIPVSVTVGKTTWETSIFPDSQSGMYLLPLKASIRKTEGITVKDEVLFILDIKL